MASDAVRIVESPLPGVRRKIIIPVRIVRSVRSAIRELVRVAVKSHLERRSEQELGRLMARMQLSRGGRQSLPRSFEAAAEYEIVCAERQTRSLLASVQRRAAELAHPGTGA